MNKNTSWTYSEYQITKEYLSLVQTTERDPEEFFREEFFSTLDMYVEHIFDM